MADRQHGTRARQAADTRAKLIGSARAVFEEKGYLPSSVADIVKHAGVAHGTFYHYFKSREDVFAVIAQEAEDRLHEAGEAGWNANPDQPAADRIRARLSAFFEAYRDQVKIMRAIEEVTRYDVTLRRTRIANTRSFGRRFNALIRDLQAEGIADPALDPVLTTAILGSITLRFPEMWLIDHVVDGGFDKVVDHVTTVFVKTLGLDRPVPVKRESRSIRR